MDSLERNNLVPPRRRSRVIGVGIVICAVSLLLFISPASLAQIQLALPLEGFYRAGQYMPVLVITGEQSGALEIGADVPTLITPPANSRIIVPVLMLQGAQQRLTWGANHQEQEPLPLQPLRDDQRLVALASAVDADLRLVFPNQLIVTARLSAVDPLPGWPGAWDCLDAILCDVMPENGDELLAAGITIVVQSRDGTEAHSPRILGPASARFDERLYLPAQNWRPAQPRAMRQLLLLIGALMALLGMGIALWRSRGQLPAMALLVLVVMVTIELYRRAQSFTMQRRMIVMLDERPSAPVDHWTWHKAMRASAGQSDVSRLTYPIFASAAHLRSAVPRLRCAANGTPEALEWRLNEGASLALLTREAPRTQDDLLASDEISPLMLEMARRVYGVKGIDVVGDQNRIMLRRRPQ